MAESECQNLLSKNLAPFILVVVNPVVIHPSFKILPNSSF
jgi:hypothetical protein